MTNNVEEFDFLKALILAFITTNKTNLNQLIKGID